MNKKDSNSSSRHMCDRIKNASASVCAPFKAIRRVTHRHSSPSPALETPQAKPTPHDRNKKITEIHPRPHPPHIVKVGSNVGKKSKANPEVESHNKTGVHIEERFSEYINRARNIFRTSTFVAADHGKGSKDQNDAEISRKASVGKDHKFNEFIDRAKKKFRTTSSIGGGRSVSFK